jgi:hypothetical protein
MANPLEVNLKGTLLQGDLNLILKRMRIAIKK